MRPDDQVRLRHLREAANKAIGYSKGKQRNDLDDDELLRLALTKLVEIVGEAANVGDGRARPRTTWTRAAGRRGELTVRGHGVAQAAGNGRPRLPPR